MNVQRRMLGNCIFKLFFFMNVRRHLLGNDRFKEFPHCIPPLYKSSVTGENTSLNTFFPIEKAAKAHDKCLF